MELTHLLQTVLAADLEKSREDMKQLQQRLNDANQKLAKEEKETKKLTERTTKWEEERTAMLAAKKEADATLESLKKQLEDEKAKRESCSRYQTVLLAHQLLLDCSLVCHRPSYVVLRSPAFDAHHSRAPLALQALCLSLHLQRAQTSRVSL